MEVMEREDVAGVRCRKGLDGCGDSELENRSKRAEERCVELELEIVKRDCEYAALEAEFRALEREKIAIEEEIKALRRESGGDEKKKNRGGEKGEGIGDLTEENGEEDKVCQLMVEIKALECEKKKAESEFEAWKQKFKELESLVLKGGELPLDRWMKVAGVGSLNVDSLEDSGTVQLNKGIKLDDELQVEGGLEYSRDKDMAVDRVDVGSTRPPLGKEIGNLQSAGTLCNDTPCKHWDGIKGENKRVCVQSDMKYSTSRQARKRLEFDKEGNPCKKMAPCTPGGGIPSSLTIVNISDSDDELLPANNQESRKVCISSGSVLGETGGCEKDMTTKICAEEDVDNINEGLLASKPKRKRALNIVTSDSESSDDDIPIGQLKKMHLKEIIHDKVGSDLNDSSVTATVSEVDNAMGTVSPPRRRLVRLRKCGAQKDYSAQTSETKYDRENLANEDVEDDDVEESGSESEGESLGGFIVEDDSAVSDGHDASTKSEGSSDDDVDFDEILSKFQRNKDQKSKWEFEADMLSAFGKDPELCMKAVCALYRQQTSEEQYTKGSLCTNSRGFSKFDALKGSLLAEFLTNGDPNGDLKRTVKELQAYDPRGIETCRTLASRYSKQLFEIYKNKEDPLFLPF
ncbi:uncharacterized protein LOC103948061 [Pyrus x bretschneideri]|uniref:uncharacterized protein LOC103948061 n=1 Tax=Pyrus x bretschneideri TaxID=225117 RepID=UPI0020309B0A|nr:uncharacterized protein LOC103948061 [Pyrus x bretschneideri]XP_018503185.2 uncharacterized protein LOC103948061 [Pyrus x bretschneideri]XP_048421502.1 uncharacterized protein LOC103948061 [Pyrus x bretschneideri]